MKKLILMFMVFAFAVMLSNADGALYGCAKKNNGQLRIVNDKSKCLPSEKVIILNQFSSDRSQFVGFSTATCTGGVGILKMHKMCQTDFPNSRMCMSWEIIQTNNLPSAIGTAWVQPIVADSYNGIAYDISGVSNPYSELTCHGWSSSDGQTSALAVTSDGQFGIHVCSDILSVACCAPVQ